MIRRTMVVLLLLASAGSVVLLSHSSGPRGLSYTLYEEPGWAGDVLRRWTAKHIDHGSSLGRHRVSLPDDSSLRATGWIFVPRRGAYEFEVESDDDNWLYIDDQLVCSNRGGRRPKARSRMIERGFHAFRLDTHHKKGGHKTLVRWKMPAGYMDLESIPPFFIRPEAPNSSPLPWSRRLIPVVLFAAALLLLLSERCARGIRRLRQDRSYRTRVAAGLTIFLFALGVRNTDINGAGETCDEWAYAMAGQIYVSNTVHGYFQSTYWNSNDEHPPIGKYIYGLTSHLVGSDDYGPLRRASALLSALTVWLTFLIGLRLFSLPIAITAGLVLALLPHVVAHGKVAGLDSPSAFFYTLTIIVFLKAVQNPRINNGGFWLAGLLGSLAFATKFSNATVFIFMVAVYVYREWPQLRTKGTLKLPISLYVLPALPLIVLFLTWPWLWREPFGQLVKTQSHWNYPISEWFLGRYQKPPLYYYPVYLLATIPAGLILPVAMFFMTLRQRVAAETTSDIQTDLETPPQNADDWRRERLSTPSAKRYIVLFWLLSSLLWSFSSFKQDGVRYIYTALPAIALMVGIGLDTLVRRIQWWPAAWVVMTGYLGWQLITIHPYYLDYYNELVGGTEPVWENRLLEVGWWGEGIPSAVAHMNSIAHEGATWAERGPVTHTFHGLRKDLVRVEKNADYLICSNVQPGETEIEGYDVDFEVKAKGAPLVMVFIKLSTLKEMRLGLDPTETTDIPFDELGKQAKENAEKALKRNDSAPSKAQGIPLSKPTDEAP